MPKAKSKIVFICEACGNESPKWSGQCQSCGKWNTMVEMKLEPETIRDRTLAGMAQATVKELRLVSTDQLPRMHVSSGELDRVLGGGVVPGSVALVAGDPGIGKSTLLLRLAADISNTFGDVLYVSGEESMSQVKMRADRLGIPGARLFMLQTASLRQVMEHLEKNRPVFVVVDSIQTMFDESVESGAGTVAQVRECARVLIEWAKVTGVPIILTGHVTKGGDIAGPRILEHMVDVVLYMEGDPVSSWRILRSVKNRFGSTNEVGVFDMSERGLIDVPDPSKAFVADRRIGVSGSVIVSTMEGSRPLLAEVQALASPSFLAVPRRIATGVDFNRLLQVCAVLSRQAGVSLAGMDIVANVAGGLRITEPGADLGTAMAIVSSIRDLPVPPQMVVIGEIGLGGEVRSVSQLDRRITEAKRLGLRECIIPARIREKVSQSEGFRIITVETVREAINITLGRYKKKKGLPSVSERPIPPENEQAVGERLLQGTDEKE